VIDEIKELATSGIIRSPLPNLSERFTKDVGMKKCIGLNFFSRVGDFQYCNPYWAAWYIVLGVGSEGDLICNVQHTKLHKIENRNFFQEKALS
jgi:hypothetical protein